MLQMSPSWHIIGERGSGKTVFIMLCAEDAFLGHREIYLNFDCKLHHKEIILEQLVRLELKNALIGIDEAHIIADSRQSGSTLNRLLSYVIYQSRKIDVDVLLVSQFSTGVDIRLRDTADYHVICEKLPNEIGFLYSICKRDYAFIPSPYGYNFGNLKLINRFYVLKKQLKRIFSLYDTYALFDITKTERLKKESKDIVKNIKDKSDLSDSEKGILEVLKKK